MLVSNKAQCLKCGDVIESLHRHDYVQCTCSNLAVDGGLEYIKRCGDPANYKDMNTYSTQPYEIVRKVAYRLSRGTQGKTPLTKITLENMSDKYLEASIKYCEERDQRGEHWRLLVEEQIFRIQHEISIPE